VTRNNKGLKNISSLISSEAEKAIGRKDSSNTFRHAIHTHGAKEIGTEEIASSCQHSAIVAKKHYLHKKTSSAFPKFFNLVKTNNEDTKQEDTNNENEYSLNDWVVVVYEKWFVGKIISRDPLIVTFMQEFLNEKWFIFQFKINSFLDSDGLQLKISRKFITIKLYAIYRSL